MKIDYSLYLVTDARLSGGRSNRQVIAAAIRGGATLVQYREKNASTRSMIDEALQLRELCRAEGVAFIVNDRVDLALAVDADGVHVGQDDLPASLARKLIGPGKILGVSAENVEQARAAIASGADYLGVGALFATATKPDAGNPIGIRGLESIVRASTVPIVGIAGINASNAAGVIRAGAAGVAVVSAVVSAPDVERAARELRQVVDQARKSF
jgi:thiamine-phosphate pyrophosphorylase